MAGSTRTVQVNIVGDSSKLSSAMKKAGDDTVSAKGRIVGAWSGVASTLSSVFGSALEPVMSAIDGAQSAFENAGENVKKRAGLMMAGIGAAGIGAGGVLTAFGSKEKAADAQLAQTYSNIGENIDDFKGRISSTVDKMAKYGYTSDQVKSSLNELTAATKNPKQALDLMSTAANLAAMRHTSLDQATQQLIQVVGGRGTRVLAELGIQHAKTANSAAIMSKATTQQQQAQANLAKAQQHLSDLEAIDHGKKTLTIADHIALRNAQDAVTAAQAKLATSNNNLSQAQQAAKDSGNAVNTMLGQIAQRTNGQASAAADTWTGKMRALRAEVENHVAEFGQKYGPTITAASSGMALLGGATETVSAIMSKFKGADEAVTAAEGVKTAAEAVDTAAEGAEAAGATAADAASMPLILTVGLIVAAVAALGVGIYELATHWSTVWNGIKDVVDTVWHGIDGDFIQPIEGFFEGIPKFIEDHWQLILSILTGPIGAAIIWITTHFGTVVDFFSGIVSTIGGYFSTIGQGIQDAFQTAFNFVARIWNDTVGAISFHIPSWVPGIGGDGFSMPKIPYLAQGGIVTGPTQVMVGDNVSGKEAIVPLEKAGQMGFGGQQQQGGDIVLVLDGREVGRAAWPYVRSSALQTTGRNATRTGLA